MLELDMNHQNMVGPGGRKRPNKKGPNVRKTSSVGKKALWEEKTLEKNLVGGKDPVREKVLVGKKTWWEEKASWPKRPGGR